MKIKHCVYSQIHSLFFQSIQCSGFFQYFKVIHLKKKNEHLKYFRESQLLFNCSQSFMSGLTAVKYI